MKTGSFLNTMALKARAGKVLSCLCRRQPTLKKIHCNNWQLAGDYYLSYASPLGIPFNNFRKSSSEQQRVERLQKEGREVHATKSSCRLILSSLPRLFALPPGIWI